MVPEFVERTRGSQWMQAQPAGASPSRRACGETEKAEFGNSNVWFPNSSRRTRGSQWVQAQPAGASPSRRACGEIGKSELGNSNVWFPNSSREPAAASGSRHCRPPLKGEVSAKRTEGFAALVGQRLRFLDHEESGGFDLWPTDSLGRREQLAPGTARSSIGCAAASGCRLSLPGKGGLCDGLA